MRPRYDTFDRIARAFGLFMLGACSVGLIVLEICVGLFQ